MKRVGALLGAMAMVVAALAVRGTFSGEDDDAGGGPGAGDSGSLVCPDEFRAVCGDVDGAVVERAGTTADRLIEGDGDAAALQWIVPSAWAELVVAERDRLGRTAIFEIDDDPVASSPVVLAVWEDRASQLRATCDAVDWRCLAEKAGTPLEAGDQVRTGMPPIDSATGLVVAGAQAVSLLGTADFAANDFAGDFDSLAARLSAGQRDRPLDAMRSRGPGQLTAAGVVAADATNLDSTLGTITTLDGRPLAVRVDVVILSRGGGIDDELRAELRRRFEAAGWAEPASGPTGLPAGGVLAAIRTLWSQNR